jgi:S-adenosylmethionine:tRNA ribosyltransferase-isomerase
LYLDSFDFNLPKDLIASEPPKERGKSRLLVLDKGIQDKAFSQLRDSLMEGDLLVLNNTKVLKARIKGQKKTGAQVEILIERIEDIYLATAQTKSNSKLKEGDIIYLEGESLEVLVLEKLEYLCRLQFSRPVRDVLELKGNVPLPPYIKRPANNADETRYQTVYAHPDKLNSVAAPTAGLHFNSRHLESLSSSGIQFTEITLDIGLGTFKPIKVSNIRDHVIHKERISIDQQSVDCILKAKQEGRRVVSVGTTVLRTLESVASMNGGNVSAYKGETSLFIYPGYEFQVVDALITNFHLPKSSLFLLVSAFGGSERMMSAYLHAIDSQYKFFSYGDAMFISAFK